MIPLAHAGHWYHTLLYIAPIILIAGGLWWSGRHVRDEDDVAGDDPAEPGTSA